MIRRQTDQRMATVATRGAPRVEVSPLTSTQIAPKQGGVLGPPMSGPAESPLKPDGTRYLPGERLAIGAAMACRKTRAKLEEPEEELDYDAEIERAANLMFSRS